MSKAGGWSVGHRAVECASSGRKFEPGDRVVSALYDGAEGFSRKDLLEVEFEREDVRGEPFSWWTSVVPEPEQKKPTFDLGIAREFLVRLLAENTPERAPLRYLLTLLLMRKRAVKVIEQFSDERDLDGSGSMTTVEVMSVRIPPSETEHEILCPELSEDEADGLRDELGRLFDL